MTRGILNTFMGHLPARTFIWISLGAFALMLVLTEPFWAILTWKFAGIQYLPMKLIGIVLGIIAIDYKRKAA